jgi:hypothetical protein
MRDLQRSPKERCCMAWRVWKLQNSEKGAATCARANRVVFQGEMGLNQGDWRWQKRWGNDTWREISTCWVYPRESYGLRGQAQGFWMFHSQLHHSFAVWSWASWLMPLNASFLIWKLKKAYSCILVSYGYCNQIEWLKTTKICLIVLGARNPKSRCW